MWKQGQGRNLEVYDCKKKKRKRELGSSSIVWPLSWNVKCNYQCFKTGLEIEPARHLGYGSITSVSLIKPYKYPTIFPSSNCNLNKEVYIGVILGFVALFLELNCHFCKLLVLYVLNLSGLV